MNEHGWNLFPSTFLMGFLSLIASTNPALCASPEAQVDIKVVIPPEKEFFSKVLDFHGIPIKAHAVVSDEALYAAYGRLSMLLPEWRRDKGKPLEEYHGLTRDQRTRGMGGLLTSCGEENLLKLETDRYRGRDICLHEFAHCVRNHGVPRPVRARFDEQFHKSLAAGLWQKSYAGSNPDEFFAELTMWYFGTHGDLRMTGPKPDNGSEGLNKYDPEAFALLDDFYSGRMKVMKVPGRKSVITDHERDQ